MCSTDSLTRRFRLARFATFACLLLAGVAMAQNAAPSTPPAPPQIGRAVIFGISEYADPQSIPTLPGVPRDMHSATAMAQLMGISKERIRIHRDAEASKEAITAILKQLAREVVADEPVLVYYSGHGGRMADPKSPKRCVEGLITHDGELLTATEMAGLLRPLAKLTDNLFVFFDACHSGGLSATRALAAGDNKTSRLRPKFVARGDTSNCDEIVNVLRTPPPETRATGRPFVYAAAARADEVSLDDPQKGGLATSNFLRCMVEGGPKQTVDQLRACAQRGIDEAVAGSSSYKPPNMSITGDLGTAPMRAELSSNQRRKLLAAAVETPATASPLAGKSAPSASLTSPLPGKGWPVLTTPRQAFAALLARSDAGVKMQVRTPETLKIDVEQLKLDVTASADGFLYLLQASSDGQSAVLLFPNQADGNNRVKQGEALALPRATWPLLAGGPEGESELLVVFARRERDLGQLIGKPAGPFLDLDVSPEGARAIARAMSLSACGSEKTAQRDCSTPVTVVRRTIREVR